MADEFAADDPVVLRFGVTANARQALHTEARWQGRIGENRLHAGDERRRIGGEAMVGSRRVLTDEQHRRAAFRDGERPLLGDADPELPVLAIGDAWPE